MEITRLSHSTVSDYQDCGEKVRLKKVMGAKPFPSLALLGGSAVHDVTANLDTLDFGWAVEGPTTFQDAFEAKLTETETETDVPRGEFRVAGKATKSSPNKEDIHWWFTNGPIFVQNWRRFMNVSPYVIDLTPDGEPAIEIEVNALIGEVPVKGFIDRVVVDPDGHEFIVDLKTGIRKPKPKQLLLYRILMDETFGGRWTPRYGFYFMNRPATMTSPEDLALLDDGATEFEFESTWRGIKANVFPPNTTSGWCSSCDVAQFCYAQNGELSAPYVPYTRKS